MPLWPGVIKLSLWKSRSEVPDAALPTDPLPPHALSEADVVITPNEPNERHGIGIIVERFFGGQPNLLSIRSHDSFAGEQKFGTANLRISHAGLSRWESYGHLLRILNGSTVRRIICIPFFPDDLITASRNSVSSIPCAPMLLSSIT